MFIPFNDETVPWKENEDITQRHYWPRWSDYREVVNGEYRENVSFHCDIWNGPESEGLVLCSGFYHTYIAHPGSAFCYHIKTTEDGEVKYITLNDMLETIQRNFWRFRHAYWEMLAKEGLNWIKFTSAYS